MKTQITKTHGLISKQMNKAINEQIGNELTTQVQYIAIAAHFDHAGLPALAQHFYKQADEERMHALKFVKFLADAGGSVRIPAIPEPLAEFKSAEAAVRRALDGEIAVTRQINTLVDRAVKEPDHITHNFLQWFVTEQLEEVSSMDTLLKIVQRAGESNLLSVEEYLTTNPRLAHGSADAPDGGKA